MWIILNIFSSCVIRCMMNLCTLFCLVLQATEFIREQRQRVYCVLAGQLLWEGPQTVNTCWGMDWKRALALHLWSVLVLCSVSCLSCVGGGWWIDQSLTSVSFPLTLICLVSLRRWEKLTQTDSIFSFPLALLHLVSLLRREGWVDPARVNAREWKELKKKLET